MFTKLTVKQEIVDKEYDQKFDQILNQNVFSYESSLKTLAVSEIKEPTNKKIKIESKINDPRLLRHRSKCLDVKPEPKVECKQEIDLKVSTKVKNKFISSLKPLNSLVDNKLIIKSAKHSSTSHKLLYENVLQEIFQWSHEWLQGSVRDKPPLLKFEENMKRNEFKYEYGREDYISRYLPYIMRGLFLKMSDTFKNEAPSRSEHLILINDLENPKHIQLNRMLNCYSLRDIRHTPKPITRTYDIIIVSLAVKTGNILTKKNYFGIITSHLMLETNELDKNVIKLYESLTNTKLDDHSKKYFLWDQITILTKRALNSHIVGKQLAKMDVLLNASFELRLIENLLDETPKCNKLISNIFSANANIHQFSAEELKDVRAVGKTLCINAMEMISKSSPMVFFKGINKLMAVDISDNRCRFKHLCDIVSEAIDRTAGKLRILVITSSKVMNQEWLKNVQMMPRSIVRPWYVDSSRGWTRHVDVIKTVIKRADKFYESLSSKLKLIKKSDVKTYEELFERKLIYKEIKDGYKSSPSPYNKPQKSSFFIAKEELYNKGFEDILNDYNVIIGTFYDVLNCDHLFNDKSKPFDCCIIDDCHLLSDPFIMSVIHLGINSMIIGGDSEKETVLSDDTIAMEYKYNISLFERIIKKCMKFI